eukprot:gnl/TRDRNA2_/TRDRNA2_132456_c1_seq4.p1 gnl/TRDRNA2_/TRDRNA2_132456_c1~~gnl/TRDRNA2_/TRDRNA2_132456_c1_seq4.p1  ORF type:complete len:339 (-),score=62.92 gnl/TRDRNA2_/TRDRNA2_132456_c1_seq4:97-1113(-)
MADVEHAHSQTNVHAAFRKLTGGMEKGTFRHRVAHYIESPAVEILVLLLVIADVVLVSIEAGIDHHVFCVNGYRIPGVTQREVLEPWDDHAEEAHFLQVGPPSWNDPFAGPLLRGGSRAHYIGPGQSFLEQYSPHNHDDRTVKLIADVPAEHHHGHEKPHDDGHGHEHHEDHAYHHDNEHAHGHPLGPPGALVCEDRYGIEAHNITHQCHIWSIVILSIFVIELSIKLAVNPKEFCGNPFHVLDFVIVVLSLIVDTFVMWYIAENAETLRNKKDEVEMIIVLLIICRIWRVVRIVHGIFEVAHEQHEHQAELKHEMAELEEKNKELEKELEGLKKGKK